MTKAHIIAIPFTGVGLHGGYRGDTWFKHRIEVFKNFTLKSLANQSNKDFLVWCWFREEERDNPLVEGIAQALEDSGLPYVFSFHGLLYVDDKFRDYTLKTKLRNLAQMLWDGSKTGEWKPLRTMWRATWENKNETLDARVRAALEELEEQVWHHDWIYLTRLDSDDMFHQDAVALIQSEEPEERRALVMDKGYMYNVVTGQLAEWLPPTNPPFHTIIFPGDVFFDPEKHLAYYGAFASHEDIPKVFHAKTLDMYRYCVTAHGKHHISTAWDVPIEKRLYQKFKYARPYCYTTSGRNISTHWQSHTLKKRNMMLGQEYTGEERAEILSHFGI